MMLNFFPLLSLIVLAGQALAAFNVTFGSSTLLPAQMLDISDQQLSTFCQNNCTSAGQKFELCQDDAGCLCSQDTVSAFLACEQCMFTKLIVDNKPILDPKAGSTPLLAAYATACNATGHKSPSDTAALVLPPTWDGPFVAILPVGGAAVTVIVGVALGISALFLLSNM
ncbi:hypothetical protein BD779DRAFT_667201 [Infundibulicybe gibba]|nr:hypothetical protein BD779DRAFT_667201 [Infundibulicybe gibba]